MFVTELPLCYRPTRLSCHLSLNKSEEKMRQVLGIIAVLLHVDNVGGSAFSSFVRKLVSRTDLVSFMRNLSSFTARIQ